MKWSSALGPTSTVIPLSGPINAITTLALSALVALVGVAVLATIVSLWRRASMERRGQMSSHELHTWRTSLVESVGEASQTHGSRIALRGFWRGTGLTKPERFVILKDLIDRQVLYPAYSPDGTIAFFQQLSWKILRSPVTSVRLSDLHWQRLATGASPSIVANGPGDIIYVQGSPGTGVISRSPGAQQTVNREEVTLDYVQNVIEALEQDLQALVPGTPLREQAESHAASLKRDVAAMRPDAAKKTLADIVAFTANSAALWAATLTILNQH